MHTIELDAENWKTVLEFYDDLLLALGSPEGHVASVDALLDSMIWGGMNDLDPPYTIRIANASKAKPKVRQELSDLSICIDEAKEEYRCRKGNNIEVFFEVMP